MIKGVGVALFIITGALLCYGREHLLNVFIIMEFFLLSMVMMVICLDVSHSGLLMLTLSFGSAEAGLSLSLLFVMMRNRGNDLVSSLSLFK